MRRFNKLMLGKAELWRNIERMDKFCEEICDIVDQRIAYLSTYRDSWIQRMQAEKEEVADIIKAAIQEAEICLLHGSFPANGLSKALLTQFPLSMRMIACSVNVPDMETISRDWVIYHNTLQSLTDAPVNRYFSVAACEHLMQYDMFSGSLIERKLSLDFSDGGRFIELDRNILICIGNNPATSAVYALSLVALDFWPLSPLLIERNAPGVAKAGRFVYVFGGRDRENEVFRSCEKFDIENSTWSDLGQMSHPRASFIPCYYRSLIYLVSTYSHSHRTIESFSPDTEVFTVLPITLPEELHYGQYSMAFVVGEELFLMNGWYQMAHWKMDSEREFRVSRTEVECWSTQPPLVLGKIVLIGHKRDILAFDPRTHDFDRLSDEDY